MEDKELNIIKAVHLQEEGFSRRVFMQLASAAGISLAMTPSVSKIAEAAGTVKAKLASQTPTLANQYYNTWNRGAISVTKGLGIDLVNLNHEFDITRLLSQVRGLPASQANMLISQIYPSGALPNVAKICQSSSVQFVALWDTIEWFTPPDVGDYYVSFQAPYSVEEAYEVAKLLFESIGGEGKVAHILGVASANDTNRTLGVELALKEYPGIQLVGKLRTDWDREEGRKVMLSMLGAHPDMKGVFCQNDNIALGVLAAMRERNITNIKVVGIDGVPDGLKEVAKGGPMIGTHSTLIPFQSGFAAVTAFDALNGWKPTLGERMLHTGALLTTAENAADVDKKLYAPDAEPYDWKLMSRTLNPDKWDPQNKIWALDPEVFWKNTPEGREKLNKIYDGAKERGEFSKVDALYAEHYKSGPFKA
ncbi:sugar ABC transporter substrate-binding protein [Agrobacterium tumefaciens]|uniref:sugar ABC transporter substrate-binding protein n=1 Tax=Agrobacterium tumefaciens TaxID=358 RepID=UPI0015733546|nr:sugar ABC transporter substrate-binding protein [Agrobacterium tumefaciens]NTB94903.1 sugar ABC transporter substrate-binding protein [Agrobacterium tumefaciens]NTC44024.1 sugar ABC transporter substrate-binding protein [Agrobacterium tumefaciens]